jgi:hypothetical protein
MLRAYPHHKLFRNSQRPSEGCVNLSVQVCRASGTGTTDSLCKNLRKVTSGVYVPRTSSYSNSKWTSSTIGYRQRTSQTNLVQGPQGLDESEALTVHHSRRETTAFKRS